MERLLPFQASSRPEPRNESQIIGIHDQAAGTVIEALASDTTREVLVAIYEEAGTASEIAERVDTSLQNARYHLDKLQDVDLVEVVDTWYSAQGKEMDVYAPTNDSVVMITGDQSTTSSLRKRLRRLIGMIGVLTGGSVIVEYSVRLEAQSVYHRQFDSSVRALTSEPGVWVSPGLLFFTGGLFVLLAISMGILWSTYR